MNAGDSVEVVSSFEDAYWIWVKGGGVALLFLASAAFGASAWADKFPGKFSGKLPKLSKLSALKFRSLFGVHKNSADESSFPVKGGSINSINSQNSTRSPKSRTEEWAQRDACPKFSQIPVVPDRTKPNASWPPVQAPAEALPVLDLMAINSALIRDLCYASKLSETEYEAFLLPVIANLAHVVHLLPASAYDHHQGYGGLFMHSLEVAYYAANQAKNTIFDRTSSPKEIHWNRRRWILTCILAALVHDSGKPYTDMEVTSLDGKSWTKAKPLLDWLREESVDEYCVSFLSERTHNRHISVAVQKLEVIIPPDTFEFIGSTGIGEKMQQALRDALNLGAKGGLVGKILAGADGLSRETDALRQRHIHPAYKNVAHPQGDPLIKAIRALVSSGRWTTNYDASSEVFNTRQGCFIRWNEAIAADIWKQATSMGFTALPQNPVKISEILIDARAAVPYLSNLSNPSNPSTSQSVQNAQADVEALDAFDAFDAAEAGDDSDGSDDSDDSESSASPASSSTSSNASDSINGCCYGNLSSSPSSSSSSPPSSSSYPSNLWSIIPILTRDKPLLCLKLADANFVYDSVAPSPIECIVVGTTIDGLTERAWETKWGAVPVLRLTPEEELTEGLDEDYVHSELAAQEDRRMQTLTQTQMESFDHFDHFDHLYTG